MIDRASLFKINDAISAKVSEFGYEKLFPPEKLFFCVWELENDVNNDGFHGYYFGSSGNQAHDAVESLRTIGARHTADLVKGVNSLFGPDGPSIEWFKRQEQLNGLPESAAKLMSRADQEFYLYKDDLEALLIAYVRSNTNVLAQ
jgi:hypothetical protein